MNFRVRNIKQGHCEIWANDRPGQRYRRIAKVKRLDSGGWRWLATDHDVLPDENHVAQRTRLYCVIDCERWALKRLVERAIKEQTEESQFWCSPRRLALSNVHEFRWLFTFDEMEEIERRLKTFGGEK